jgi:streptogramin lyase
VSARQEPVLAELPARGAEPYGLAVTDDAVWATSLVAGTVTWIDPRTDRVAASRPGP